MATSKLHYKNIAADAATYVGEPGSIFFDPTTSQLRVGDGVTPGGNAVTLSIGLATEQDIADLSSSLANDVTHIQGAGFVTGVDSLHNIKGAVNVANNTINGVQLIVSSMNVTLGAIQGTSFTPGTDDLHAIRSAIANINATVNGLVTSVNAIKTNLGI